MMTIKEVNRLHALYYGVGSYRKYPEKGIVDLETVSSAAKWLRKNKKNE